jgi:hypothetical protein
MSGSGSNDLLKSRPSERVHTPKTSIDLPTQCASYALEMMSHGGIRHHAIGASIIDENITLQYYSHSVILYSKPLNFVANFPRFLSAASADVAGTQGLGLCKPRTQPTFQDSQREP